MAVLELFGGLLVLALVVGGTIAIARISGGAGLMLDMKIDKKREAVDRQRDYVLKMKGLARGEPSGSPGVVPPAFRQEMARNSYLPLAMRKLEELREELGVLEAEKDRREFEESMRRKR